MWKDKGMILLTLMLGTSMAAIDNSIVNVSLPTIRSQFNVDVSEVEWVVTAYMISFSLFIPLTNWLKNTLGYYNLFLLCVSVFTLGSLLCSVADSLPMLVISRIVQATGGGALSPVTLAIVGESFPKEERGSAVGWWGIGNVMGPAIAPTLGGVLTHYLGWPSIFYVNVPLGLLTIFFTVRYLGYLKNKPHTRTKFDFRGFAWFSMLIISLQYMVSAISNYGFYSWNFIVGAVLSVAGAILFIRSSRREFPLLDLTVFRSETFIGASIIVVMRSFALFGGVFFLPFLLQGELKYSEIASGLLIFPAALMMLVSRPAAGRLADKGYIRDITMGGIVLVAISFFLFSLMDTGTMLWMIIGAMVIRGLGIGFLVAPVSTALLNSVSSAQTATATSLNSLMLQVGGSLGIAIFNVIHSAIHKYYMAKGFNGTEAEHFALKYGFLLAAFIIALTLIPARRLPGKIRILHFNPMEKG